MFKAFKLLGSENEDDFHDLQERITFWILVGDYMKKYVQV
jgi:hypothetical protein